MMKKVTVMLGVIVLVSAGIRVHSQTLNSPSAGLAKERSVYQVVGEVMSIEKAPGRVNIKTGANELLAISLDENTVYKRVPPGETNLNKAVTVTLAEIGVGDQVYARGVMSDTGERLAVRQLVIMSKVDILNKHEQQREEWRKRGIVGTISALNNASKEITLLARSADGNKLLIIAAGGDVQFRRYAPESARFSSAQAGSFSELKVGDQLRALGEKSSDGARFTPEEIVSGSFRTVAGTVTEINAATGEIKINEVNTKRPFTVVTTKESLVRRMSPELTALLVPQKGASAAGAQGNPLPTKPPGSAVLVTNGKPRTAAGAGFDVEEELDKLKVVTISELQPGEMIIVSSTNGKDPSRLTAIAIITDVNALLKSLQGNVQSSAKNEVNTPLGLPSSLQSISIGLP
jgi:hypothetical protein